MNHSGTQTIETPRIVLRRFCAGDCHDMLKNWAADPAVQSEYGEPVYASMPEINGLLETWIINYARTDFYRWAIVEKAHSENIGQIAFCRVYPDCKTAEIEYCIGKAFWGNGYAAEALSAVIDFTFKNTDFYRLEAYHRIENARSGRVLEKSPMRKTENVQRFIRENKLPHGEICYYITCHSK